MREPRFEIVRTDAGWHGRFRAANGEPIWSTEVYPRRRRVLRALELVAHHLGGMDADVWGEVRDVDERTAP